MGVLGSDRATELGGLRAIVLVQRFFLDPLGALSSLEGSHGGFVRINLPLSFGNLPREVVFVAKPRQYREILGRPDVWRTVSIGAASKHHHASARLGNGIVRMRGKRHAHYRKLIVPPLRREAVAALSGDMERVAECAVDTWPVDAPFDLWARVRGLMQEAAVTHLFGAEPGLAMPVAGQITALAEGSFSLAINAFPFDLPGTPFARTMRSAERLEAAILGWAAALRGHTTGGDLMSIIVNSPDEDGNPPGNDLIVGHAPTLFGAAYETCQNAMIWSLVLLAGHPAIQEELAEELAAGDQPTSADGVAPWSLLDRVVRESMRVLPPVPTQYRVAVEDTTLGETPLRCNCRAVLSAFVRNRDPDLYPEPDRFIPSRWARIDPSPFEYAAFSAGPRSCPGFHFGIGQVKTSLRAILRRYRVEIAPNSEVDYRVGVTLRPHLGVTAVLRPRCAAVRPRPISGRINRLVRFPQ